MMDEPNWKLINAAIEDIWQWIKEAPTPEAKQYRLGLLRDAIKPEPIIHYYRDGLESQPNEEFDAK